MSGEVKLNSGSLIIEDEKEVQKNQNDKFYKPITFFSQKISQIACGETHMFALQENGRVFGWGSNDNGQLGLDSL